MVKAGVVGVKTEQAEQKQQRPEDKKKAKKLAAEFMGVRRATLPNRSSFPAQVFLGAGVNLDAIDRLR